MTYATLDDEGFGNERKKKTIVIKQKTRNALYKKTDDMKQRKEKYILLTNQEGERRGGKRPTQ